MTNCRSGPRRLVGMLLVAGSLTAILSPRVASATISRKIAYVTDFGGGANDTHGPPGSGTGSSIFRNALTGTGIPSGGTYTTIDGNFVVTVIDVRVSEIDARPDTLTHFDTVILYQVCDIASSSHEGTRHAINDFVANGGKLVIFDADRCGEASANTARYDWFLFPFSTSSPGAVGRSGSYTAIDSSALTTGLSVGPQPGDAVGDANTFVTHSGDWCASITARNYDRTGRCNRAICSCTRSDCERSH